MTFLSDSVFARRRRSCGCIDQIEYLAEFDDEAFLALTDKNLPAHGQPGMSPRNEVPA